MTDVAATLIWIINTLSFYLGDPQLKVFADEQKIDQVMVNLVNNAVKYAPAAEQIIVKAEKMEGCIKISVIDDGNGIPAASIPKLFERYFRVDPTVIRQGLAWVYTFPQKSLGDTAVKSVQKVFQVTALPFGLRFPTELRSKVVNQSAKQFK